MNSAEYGTFNLCFILYYSIKDYLSFRLGHLYSAIEKLL